MNDEMKAHIEAAQKINGKVIDENIAAIKDTDPEVADMLDQVMRPWVNYLVYHKAMKGDANAFRDATVWLMSNMNSELLHNMVDINSDGEVSDFMQAHMQEVIEASMLSASAVVTAMRTEGKAH